MHKNTHVAAVAIAFAMALTLLAQDQTSPAGPAAFDVASVRVVPPGSGGMISISPPGSPGFTAANINMGILIAMAYGVDSDRITGPGWLGSQQYDVSAKTETNTHLSYEQLRAPLQKLLEQRFQLAVHTDTKEGSGYALVVAKGGAKLTATKGGEPHSYILKTGIDIRNESLDGFVGALARPSGRPVVNETGMAGNYDISLAYAPEDAKDPSLPSIFTALQEQLGLQLVSRKVPVKTLIVDHIERIPTEN